MWDKEPNINIKNQTLILRGYHHHKLYRVDKETTIKLLKVKNWCCSKHLQTRRYITSTIHQATQFGCGTCGAGEQCYLCKTSLCNSSDLTNKTLPTFSMLPWIIFMFLLSDQGHAVPPVMLMLASISDNTGVFKVFWLQEPVTKSQLSFKSVYIHSGYWISRQFNKKVWKH